jgi:hypothetical protein
MDAIDFLSALHLGLAFICPLKGGCVSICLAPAQVLAPFTYELWGVLLLCTVIGGPIYFLIESADSHGAIMSTGEFEDEDEDEDDAGGRTYTIFRNMMQSTYLAYGVFSGQESWAPTSMKGKLMAMAWGFMMVVVGASYTANLAAVLATQQDRYSPVNLEKFVAGPYKACTLKGSAYTAWLKGSRQYRVGLH